jgi:hypothetical protein
LKIRGLIFGIGVLVAIHSAHAGPPFVTDDPEPVPPGGWEINVPFILERTPGRTEMNAPLFDLNYGLPEVQSKVEFPIKIVRDDTSGTEAGAGDLLLGVKWRFLNNEKSHLQFGIYPQVLVPRAIGSVVLAEDERRLYCRCSRRRAGTNGPFMATSDIGGKMLPRTRDYFYAGAVLERELSERIRLGAELFGNSPVERADRPDIAFNLGGT